LFIFVETSTGAKIPIPLVENVIPVRPPALIPEQRAVVAPTP